MNVALRLTLLFAAALAANGCGETAVRAKKQPAKKQPAAAAGPSRSPRGNLQPPAVKPDEYPSLEAAFADVEKMSADPLGGQKLSRIERWLDLQGERIAPDLAERIQDPATGLATRLTACRVLARMGPVATPTLLAALEGEPQQLRLKAIQSLGRVQPSSAPIVNKLLALLDEPDFETRKAALGGLKEIGPPAQEAVEKLMHLLNDTSEDETIRSLAKEALKSVQPRRGLMNAY